jgi:tRNA (guanine-N7-)-methyltransferase
LAAVRVRQHVNPLSNKFQEPIETVNWEKVYANPQQPLHLDIGCARGRFVLEMAQIEPNWNFMGLEIRKPLVEEANKLRDELRLTNLNYIFCNVNNYLSSVLSNLPPGILQRVTIQFPDPWFKNRHAKRRMVQPELVAELANILVPGGIVFLQSDLEFVAQEMCDRFSENSNFIRQGSGEWIPKNPLSVPTERETSTENRGQPVYRAIFEKVAS